MTFITRHSFFILLMIFFQSGSSQCILNQRRHSSEAEELFHSLKRTLSEGKQLSSVGRLGSNRSFILASERTNRRDPLNGFKYYDGGWNISSTHYWASVGFTAFPLFAIAAIWIVGFGLVLLLICCCYCCCVKRSYSYSRSCYCLSLFLLILFTCTVVIGCVLLYTGQGKFNQSTSNTLHYVVNQANLTVENLRNFSATLEEAKHVVLYQLLLPTDLQMKIDAIDSKINSSASALSMKTKDNTDKTRNVLNNVRLSLVIVAAVMLLLALLGFVFSVFGLGTLVYVFVLICWFLTTGTLILCGVFLLLHNVIGDTCVAMDEWVQHPQQHTALDDILPCVDAATVNESLYRSQEVTFQLVNMANQVITNLTNGNFPPNLTPFYYNQSGPLMPLLCNPFTSYLESRQCMNGEVDFSNVTEVWKNYECQVSASGICSTIGRVTPDIYKQMETVVNVAYGLYHYGPFLSRLLDCSFVRETFANINTQNCPGLMRHSHWIYIGLVMVSLAVMFSLIFWVIYARERRHRKYNR